MSVKYGKKDCHHDWVYRQDGWEGECGPTICIKCGAFGCFCDLPRPKPPVQQFFDRGVRGDANVNGQWENPYVKK